MVKSVQYLGHIANANYTQSQAKLKPLSASSKTQKFIAFWELISMEILPALSIITHQLLRK